MNVGMTKRDKSPLFRALLSCWALRCVRRGVRDHTESGSILGRGEGRLHFVDANKTIDAAFTLSIIILYIEI